MCAQIIQVGQPINNGERRVISRLKDQLDDNYIILHNLDVSNTKTRRSFDLDLIVIGVYAIYAIEIKDWGGKITGDLREWKLSNSEIRPNPVNLILHKARVLSSYLSGQNATYRKVEVIGLVAIATDHCDLGLDSDLTKDVFLLGELKQAITDPNYARRSSTKFPTLSNSTREGIFQAIFKNALPSRKETRFREYSVIDQFPPSSKEYTDFLAKHELIQERVVKLRVYETDPYTGEHARKVQQERVLREARILSELNKHSNIITVFDVFPYDNNKMCLALEWHPNMICLKDFMSGSPLDKEFIEHIILEVCSGLKYLHSKSIYHRNISSKTIYLKEGNQIVISEFLFSKHSELETLGTLHLRGLDKQYMSPEQYLNPHEVDQRSDIYSLGVLFFELMFQDLPYNSVVERIKDLSNFHLLEKIKDSSLTDNVRLTLIKMLEASPDSRLSSVDEIVNLLTFL